MKLQRHNLVLLALLLVLGLSLFAWWGAKFQQLKATTWKSIPPELSPLPQTAPPQPTNGNPSLERPLFWESRRPLPTQATPNATAASPLELLGIVTEGAQRVALLRPLQGTPPLQVHRLRVGDNYNGTTLQEIDNDQVTLKGTSGVETIKIKRGSQNPGFSNQPAKLSAPASIEITREKPQSTPQNRIDELKAKAAQQAQQPVAAP